MTLPRFLRFAKYETIDFKEYLSDNLVEIHLKRKLSTKMQCCRCGGVIKPDKGCYPVRVQHMMMGMNHCYIIFRRYKGHCSSCKKTRSEKVNFISQESPHKSKEFAWWLGRLCEVAPVSRVAEIYEQSGMSTWRLDYKRMKRMLKSYFIPKVKNICVDEVYSRSKKEEGETRDDLFFTIICDLDTRRVIWVSSSRRKEALDEFFLIIGKRACEEIKVVAADMHDAYGASVKQHCPNATLVWDRFHVMQAFDNMINEERKTLHTEADKGTEEKRLSRGKFRFMFLKKESRRTEEERLHIEDVYKENERFLKLELIKEKMHQFFNARNVEDAWEIFDELGSWIWQAGFAQLLKWHNYMEGRWGTLKNYFIYRVSSGLAEGMNNVIKTIKRKGYGYRNMHYFKLKILQICGYLNSRYISIDQLE